MLVPSKATPRGPLPTSMAVSSVLSCAVSTVLISLLRTELLKRTSWSQL
jgi:hypothetical protein